MYRLIEMAVESNVEDVSSQQDGVSQSLFESKYGYSGDLCDDYRIWKQIRRLINPF